MNGIWLFKDKMEIIENISKCLPVFFIMPSVCIKQGDTVEFMSYLQSTESQEGPYIISG